MAHGSIEAGKSEQEFRDRVTVHLQVHREEERYRCSAPSLSDIMQGLSLGMTLTTHVKLQLAQIATVM